MDNISEALRIFSMIKITTVYPAGTSLCPSQRDHTIFSLNWITLSAPFFAKGPAALCLLMSMLYINLSLALQNIPESFQFTLCNITKNTVRS